MKAYYNNRSVWLLLRKYRHARRVNNRNRIERCVWLVSSVDNHLASPAIAISKDKLSTLLLHCLSDLHELRHVVRWVGKPAKPFLHLLLVLGSRGREPLQRPRLVALEEVGHEHLRTQILRENVCALLSLRLEAETGTVPG